MRFKRSAGGIVEFGEDALQAMQKYRQTSFMSSEAGGMLLGRLINNSADVVVDQVSVPSADDRRWRFFFFRKREPAQKIVEKVWIDSKATTNYLGEWHTHPEDVPTPSSIDLSEWRRISQTSAYEQDFLLFVIVGRLQLLVWEVPRDGTEVIALPSIG